MTMPFFEHPNKVETPSYDAFIKAAPLAEKFFASKLSIEEMRYIMAAAKVMILEEELQAAKEARDDAKEKLEAKKES